MFPGIFAAGSPSGSEDDEVRDKGRPRGRAPHPDIEGAEVEGHVEVFKGEDDEG